MVVTVFPHENLRAQPSRPLRVIGIGLVPYAEAWGIQNRLAAELGSGMGDETLLLLEHPHTYTCGRSGGRDHILISEAEMSNLGIAVLDVDRGGDITYHGPGQLVAYPIIDLSSGGSPIDYPGYVRTLEQVLIDTLADFAITSHRIRHLSGVWIRRGNEDVKLAAIGVKVDGHGVTTHGVALNVNTDLQFFDGIVPCGIRGKGVGSMAQILPEVPTIGAVMEKFALNFRRVFGFDS